MYCLESNVLASMSLFLPSTIRLTLRVSEGRSIDRDGMAVMPQATEQGVDHLRIAQEVGPFVLGQICCNDCWPMAISLFHEFEKDVRLFRFYVEVSHLVDQKDVEFHEPIEELA